ncbi:hypothetical protein [Streptomyces sp. WM6378]|uniref:hypothetical protein n=1 Tax=Streptomyces sp. WM6378 TaxID=1415557 RepID=UPI00131E44F6|nr:hypothetical protein [Streptomyces sp. WM6378]
MSGVHGHLLLTAPGEAFGSSRRQRPRGLWEVLEQAAQEVGVRRGAGASAAGEGDAAAG